MLLSTADHHSASAEYHTHVLATPSVSISWSRLRSPAHLRLKKRLWQRLVSLLYESRQHLNALWLLHSPATAALRQKAILKAKVKSPRSLSTKRVVETIPHCLSESTCQNINIWHLEKLLFLSGYLQEGMEDKRQWLTIPNILSEETDDGSFGVVDWCVINPRQIIGTQATAIAVVVCMANTAWRLYPLW